MIKYTKDYWCMRTAPAFHHRQNLQLDILWNCSFLFSLSQEKQSTVTRFEQCNKDNRIFFTKYLLITEVSIYQMSFCLTSKCYYYYQISLVCFSGSVNQVSQVVSVIFPVCSFCLPLSLFIFYSSRLQAELNASFNFSPYPPPLNYKHI